PVVAVMLTSLASLSVLDTTLVAMTAPPALMVIAPLAVVRLVSVTAFASSSVMPPAPLVLAVTVTTAGGWAMPRLAAAVGFMAAWWGRARLVVRAPAPALGVMVFVARAVGVPPLKAILCELTLTSPPNVALPVNVTESVPVSVSSVTLTMPWALLADATV